MKDLVGQVEDILSGNEPSPIKEQVTFNNSPKAVREYQMFEGFEDPEFFADNANFDKIIDELNRQDPFVNASIGSKKSMREVVNQFKKDKEHFDQSLKNDKTLSVDPDAILKQGLSNLTMVEQDLQKCLEQQKELEMSQKEVEGIYEGRTLPVSEGTRNSAFHDSKMQRKSIENSLEL